MADWRDFLFGRKALGQAAGEPPQNTPPPAQPSGINVEALAQAQADQEQPHMGYPRVIPPNVKGAPYPLPGSLSEAARKRGQQK